MGPASNTRCGPFCLSNASKYLRTRIVNNCNFRQQAPPIDSSGSWEGARTQSRIRTTTSNREVQMPLSTRSQASPLCRGSHILDISAWHIPNALILAAANDCCKGDSAHRESPDLRSRVKTRYGDVTLAN